MNLHAQEIFKRNIQFIMFIGITLFSGLAILICLKVSMRSEKPILIAIDSNGTRIISENTDPIYKTEAIAFIQKFTNNIYNFNADNFMKKVGLATSMMSEDLWKQKKSEIMDLKNKVERDEIFLTGQIKKLTVDELGIYHGIVSVSEKSRMNTQDHTVEIKIQLNAVTRDKNNPTGLEVSLYEEKTIKN